MVYDSEILVYFLYHGFYLNLLQSLFLPLNLENSKILNTFPKRIPEIKLSLERIQTLIVAIPSNLEHLLKLDHLPNLRLQPIHLALIIQNATAPLHQPLLIHHLLKYLLKLFIQLSFLLLIFLLKLIDAVGTVGLDLRELVGALGGEDEGPVEFLAEQGVF